MNILNRTNTVVEFTECASKMIEHLDQKIFTKSAKVSINRDMRNANFGLGGFQSKRWIFRKLGFSDDYVIFEKSRALETEIKKDYKVISFASHEIRHRFQVYNQKSIISADFILGNTLLPKQWMELIIEGNRKLYGRNKTVFCREVDASLVDSIISYYHKHPNLTINVVIELITSNEDTIKTTLAKLV